MARNGTTTLFRPIGKRELALIQENGYRRFPARLNGQPIFYPVLDYDYAVQIARDWNTRDANSEYTGYVTRFAVDAEFLKQFPIQTVGSSRHREYWIPAEDLEEFNSHIVGKIDVIDEFQG
jgi:hypothetical protein